MKAYFRKDILQARIARNLPNLFYYKSKFRVIRT